MSDVPASGSASGPGLDPAPVAKRTYPRLTKYASIFTTGCAVIIAAAFLYDWLGPATLLDCDDSAVQTGIRDIFHDNKTDITAMTNFKSGAEVADGRACGVDLASAGSAPAHMDYRLFLKDGHTQIQTGKITSQ